MIRSMTSFARRECNGDWGTLVCEMRSLNHRYLDLSLRMPDELRSQEQAVRDLVGARVKRGKVECSVRLLYAPNQGGALTLNAPLTRQVLDLCHRIDDLHLNHGRVSAMQVLAWPGVVEQPQVDMKPIYDALLALFGDTLDELLGSREREGQRLQQLIDQRCQAMEALLGPFRARVPEFREHLRQRLLNRLDELGLEVEPGRLEQELVFQLQKLDIDEELDRLQTHLSEIKQTLERSEPVGRRLDFLMQELNREANTLGSKANNIDTTQTSVELKVLIEQMREQIQNIE